MPPSTHRTPRFYIDTALHRGAQLALPTEAGHHAVRVLRLREGDGVSLFNGIGGEYAARIVRLSRNTVEVEVGDFSHVERESPLTITLAQGISAGDRMDLTIQKAVELGVAEIQPLMAERSVSRLKGDRADTRREHWQRVAAAACEQCGRNRVPTIASALPASEYYPPPNARKFLLSPTATAGLRTTSPLPEIPIILGIGPEAGFSTREEALLVAQGFMPIHMGPRILRTETAGPAAIAALNALAGDA